MKNYLINIWGKIRESGVVALGCALMIICFLGILFGIVAFLEWLWTKEWIKSVGSSIRNFFYDYGYIIEYIFLGIFLAFLFVCVILGIIAFIKDKQKYIITGAKAIWEWCLKGIAILIMITFCLFCMYQCFHNSNDIEPQLYEHRI